MNSNNNIISSIVYLYYILIYLETILHFIFYYIIISITPHFSVCVIIFNSKTQNVLLLIFKLLYLGSFDGRFNVSEFKQVISGQLQFKV